MPQKLPVGPGFKVAFGPGFTEISLHYSSKLVSKISSVSLTTQSKNPDARWLLSAAFLFIKNLGAEKEFSSLPTAKAEQQLVPSLRCRT